MYITLLFSYRHITTGDIELYGYSPSTGTLNQDQKPDIDMSTRVVPDFLDEMHGKLYNPIQSYIILLLLVHAYAGVTCGCLHLSQPPLLASLS